MNRHTVFICHDYMLVEVLDEIGSRLEQSGIEVVRGPQTAPEKARLSEGVHAAFDAPKYDVQLAIA
jgi:hypothetical protein